MVTTVVINVNIKMDIIVECVNSIVQLGPKLIRDKVG